MLEYKISEYDYFDYIAIIANFIENGSIGIIPTDTIYGIICLASNLKSKQKIYDIKGREISKNLVIQIGTKYNIFSIVDDINISAKKLIKAFFPGQITLIFNINTNFKKIYSIDSNTVAIRIPNHKLLLDILNFINKPIFVTSANISGSEPLNNILDLKKIFYKKVDFLVNDGCVYSNIPSTIIDVREKEIKIIREGYIDKEKIYNVLNS